MQNLTVTGTDGDALVAVADTGEEFRIPVNESVQSRVRQIVASQTDAPKVSPREIQAQIRSGLSAAEVAEATGAALEYVERFEAPILDERRHIVEQALRVPVKLHTPTDPLAEESQAFGEVIDERLEGLGSIDIRWTSWKDETGWMIKVTFTSQGIDHDARWQYDPRRHTLNPTNADAVTLSQAGEITGGMIPRLRAVGVPSAEPEPEPMPGDEVLRRAESPMPSPPVTLPEAEPEITVDHTNQTADLLEVLRRRRGEREAASFHSVDDILEEDDDTDQHEPVRPVSPFVIPRQDVDPDAPTRILPVADTADLPSEPLASAPAAEEKPALLDGVDSDTNTASAPAPKQPRRTRAPMPSWDEIVFGARERDD